MEFVALYSFCELGFVGLFERGQEFEEPNSDIEYLVASREHLGVVSIQESHIPFQIDFSAGFGGVINEDVKARKLLGLDEIMLLGLFRVLV